MASSGSAFSFLVCPMKPPKPPSFASPGITRSMPPSPTCCRAANGESSPGAGGSSGGGSKVSGSGPRRKRSPYGTSRRSALKKTFPQEQVVFSSPVADDPAVGIIGGGISGLVCAATLEDRGIRSTVFDTGVHGLGGRMGTRTVDPHPLVFDHAAQFFTARDPRFRMLVDRWIDEGLVREWKGLVGNLEVHAFNDPLPIPHDGAIPEFEGAFVEGIETVSWMANNSRKLFPSNFGGPHCWTFFSTASYGRQNKVPQENIPKVTAEKVKEDMLGGAELALGLSKGFLQPFYTRVQLWGAALPTNTPNVPCMFDPLGRAGICGDWLLGSSVEAAVLSGISLAEHIADYFQSGGDRPDEFAIGLHNSFQPIHGLDIGQFPGLESGQHVRATQKMAHL